LTFATGIKLSKPDLAVIVVMGDGDATAIGGNHLIHAARRNLDLTAIIVNNQTYGMTGGQFSPTTPFGSKASTAMFGHIENSFDISALSSTAGAAFVARSTVYHVNQMDNLLLQAIEKKGFSVVEVLSPCHTNFGRHNRLGSQVEMMKTYKKQGVPVKRWEEMSEKERLDRIPLGVLVNRDMPMYLDSYADVCKRAARLREEGKI
jgi:2-oxoglutarate ferredoxin oxidoreductase subunit beta